MRSGTLLFQAAIESLAKSRARDFAETSSSLAEKATRSDGPRSDTPEILAHSAIDDRHPSPQRAVMGHGIQNR
jgi:hypothetical protein